MVKDKVNYKMPVSTHSRPKAAAAYLPLLVAYYKCFNTQPPEGGCCKIAVRYWLIEGFNTQPPEGGCTRAETDRMVHGVSTHSRPKAAARVGKNPL